MATKKARLKNSSGDYIIPYVPVDSELSSTSENPVQNKVVNTALSGKANSSDLATVATSGSYNDLSNKPTIPTAGDGTKIVSGTISVKAANSTISVGSSGIKVGTIQAANIASGAITTAKLSTGVNNNLLLKATTSQGLTITGGTSSTAANISLNLETTISASSSNVKAPSAKAVYDALGDIKNKRDDSTLSIWHGTEYQWNHGAPTTWYYWQTSVTAQWVSGGALPSSANWNSITYGNGKFVAVALNSNKAAYSTDGINWTASTLPSSNYKLVTYGDDKFVAISVRSTNSAYSTNGINWTESYTLPTLDSIPAWNSVTYGDGKFVAISYFSTSAAYSTDGINWTASTLPSSDGSSVTYGDDKFVVVTLGSAKAAYSTDGINWTETTLPSSSNWSSVTYGDGKFVAVARSSTKTAYSTDGINWTASTLPSYTDWSSVTYGDGKFVAISSNSDKAAYSTDGVHWTATTLSSSNWSSVTYGDGKFVATKLSPSTDTSIFTITYDKCYTDTANPTTTSVVYSAPETVSSYTISSVTSGAITLSNNNTYYYNQSGNVQTYQTVGDAHPEYLCFIDGVGVKIGNTTIATNNSNS